MSKQDRDGADARFNRTGPSKAGKSEQELAAQAVRDNMARLKALRLAREAAEPPRPTAKKARAKSPKKPDDKAPALSDWLANQQSGGRRV